ncbi:DUF4123 domain-containing protein [Cupriavidus alkaliphilus]|uniref:DUF4123 domain-containing protein n=1 Tax=Cupriavidus alkaliphilus TaxID=942866 RepID=UPI000DC32A83|nr:DUF4123 domain-containing protein [Cupriavidus alkaliphilus]RAS08794.1 uncharacterized protein DUF4123 [Cupriavidus alkaliphilus]
MRNYFVIDSSQQPGYHKRLERNGISFRSLFLGSAEESLQDIAPLLVEIPSEPMQIRSFVGSEIARIASRRPCISLLESKLDIDTLAYYLRQFHTIDLPEGRRMILRWYDTRILPVWWAVLDEPQKKAFSREVVNWKYYDRFGDQLALLLPTCDDSMASCQISLSASQYQGLLEAAEPDVLISHLRNILRDELRRIPPRRLYPFVRDHLKMARNCGLENFDDQVQYLIIAIYTSGGFVGSPVVKNRLELHDSLHEVSFNEWAENLPSSVWSTGKPLWEVQEEDRCGVVVQ